MEFHLSTFHDECNAKSQLLEPCWREEESETTMQERRHKPVMLKEALSFLELKDGMVAVDCTLGLAGHALGIAERIAPGGKLIAIDKDEESLKEAQGRLKQFSGNCLFVHDDFRNFDRVMAQYKIKRVDAVLMDLGVSSFQLESPARGFSIQQEGPLDMRMDRKSFICAFDLLNNLTEEEISSILWKFGQERFSHRIARSVVRARQKTPISSTKDLTEIVLAAMPYKARFQRIHPATRTFQALRIAVNRELDALDEALKKIPYFLSSGARLCVISFHSLEDKIVKEHFRELAKSGKFRLMFKKILRPSEEEIQENPRSRSAKMRVLERIG